MTRHGLDHIGGLRLPVIADIAHAQKYLMLLGGFRRLRRDQAQGQRTQ